MALIKCPECGAQVSSSAESCPKCAYPIAGRDVSTLAHSRKIQTVEQTSRRYKLQLVLSSLLIIGSMLLYIPMLITDFGGVTPKEDSGTSGSSYCLLVLCVGLLWHCVARFKAWWHHG